VIDVIARGVEMAKAGTASALCTLPIHKKALKDGAGFAFPGHTEYLAHLDGKSHVVMMLACPELRVVPATIHIALADVRARYDVAVAMYHDQALIPIKTIDFAGGVNVTLGLDVIRTSPDHGTAFDIAGQGVADPTSTIAALRMARDMALARLQERSAV